MSVSLEDELSKWHQTVRQAKTRLSSIEENSFLQWHLKSFRRASLSPHFKNNTSNNVFDFANSPRNADNVIMQREKRRHAFLRLESTTDIEDRRLSLHSINDRYDGKNENLSTVFGLKTKENYSKGITSSNKKDDTDKLGFRVADLPWGARWLQFADTVSVVGLKYAVDAQSTNIRRLIWGMLVLLGIGFMLYQIYERTSYYLSYPVITTVVYENKNRLPFPTVTVCNENLVADSRAQWNGFDDLILDAYPPYPDPSFTPNFTSFEETFEHLRDFGYEWKDAWFYWSHIYHLNYMFYLCTFNGETCTVNDTRVVLTPMGYCFQFNGPGENKKTSVPGSYYGLNLVLDTWQHEYLYAKSRGAGFRVLLHAHNEYPSVDSKGIRISPGQQTSLAMTLTNLTLAADPYGDCRGRDNYTFEGCLSECSYQYVATKCGCQPWYAELDGYISCDPQQMYECADVQLNDFLTNYYEKNFNKECDCAPQCREVHFEHDLSTNKHSDFAIRTITRDLIATENCTNATDPSTCFYTPDLNTSIENMNNNLVDMQIFYTTMNFEDIFERPAYPFLNLLCDIGGAMGLILGSTVLTIAEITEFIMFLGFDAIYFKCAQMFLERKRQLVYP